MENKTSKGNKLLLTFILILVLCAVGLSSVTLVSQLRLQTDVQKIVNQNVDNGQEDDVVIADEYTIRSTTQISDAYKNGTQAQLSDTDKETLDMAKAVLDEIIKDDMTPYEKEEAVYLWLTKEMKPDTGMLTVIPNSQQGVDNPHGVLKNHNAVCVGYATTFRLFMQMLDIECKVVHNTDRFHSWDLVQLDDEWYHVDCYSDSGSGNFRNFNMNDTAAEADHDWNHETFPSATGTKYSYAAMHSKTLKNMYYIPRAVRKMLDKNESVGAFSFKEKIEESDETAAMYLVNRLSDRLNEAPNFYVDMSWSLDDSGNYILGVYITHYDEEDNLDVDEKISDKIDSVISKAFFDYVFETEDDYDYENAGEDYFETTTVAYG